MEGAALLAGDRYNRKALLQREHRMSPDSFSRFITSLLLSCMMSTGLPASSTAICGNIQNLTNPDVSGVGVRHLLCSLVTKPFSYRHASSTRSSHPMLPAQSLS